jgi:hypothetical protein
MKVLGHTHWTVTPRCRCGRRPSLPTMQLISPSFRLFGFPVKSWLSGTRTWKQPGRSGLADQVDSIAQSCLPIHIMLAAAIVLTLTGGIGVSAGPHPQGIRYLPHNIHFSHLSPLFRYSPSASWDFSHSYATSTTPGANISLDIFADKLYLWGKQSGSEFDISPWLPRIYPDGDAPNYRLGTGEPDGLPVIIEFGIVKTPLVSRRVSFQLPSSLPSPLTPSRSPPAPMGEKIPVQVQRDNRVFLQVKEAQIVGVMPTDLAFDEG